MAGFQTFHDFIGLQSFLKEKFHTQTIGLVPTMGALHIGHISLIERALEENDIVVVTIFVNPKQFNNPNDLKNYPRVPEKDLALLKVFDRVVVCMPSVDAVYPSNDPYKKVELGLLDKVLEGEFRPGHFDGVAHVVHNLMYFSGPSKAYFGLKDIQQLSVINHMVKSSSLTVDVVACDTVRDENGLALSSRNLLLNKAQHHEALIIHTTLTFVKSNIKSLGLQETLRQAKELFNKGTLNLEYIDVVDRETFGPYKIDSTNNVCCISAFCENVRLIDNILLV